MGRAYLRAKEIKNQEKKLSMSSCPIRKEIAPKEQIVSTPWLQAGIQCNSNATSPWIASEVTGNEISTESSCSSSSIWFAETANSAEV